MVNISESVASALGSVKESDELYSVAHLCLAYMGNPDCSIVDYKSTNPEGKRVGEITSMLRARRNIWKKHGTSCEGVDESITKLNRQSSEVIAWSYVIDCKKNRCSIWYNGNKDVLACFAVEKSRNESEKRG